MSKKTSKNEAPPADKAPGVESQPAKPSRAQFVLVRACALSNGRRNAGEPAFTAERAGKKGWKPGTEEKDDGLTEREFENAKNNPQLLVTK